MLVLFQTLTNATRFIILKRENAIRMLFALILRAHITALVIPHTFGMVLNAKVRLVSKQTY